MQYLQCELFDQLLPGGIGGFICLASVVLFGFSCLISYYTYAERAGEYIFGQKIKPIIKALWVVIILIGSQSTLGFAWDLADTFNGLMIIPNLIGIILLSNEAVKMKNDYFKRNNVEKIKKMRILVVGPSPTRSKGGMATVIEEIEKDKTLNSKFNIDNL